MLFTFAELLRSYRERASLDRADLAATLGVHRNTIGLWERGEYRPRYRELILRLADELALSSAETDQLLRTADFPPAHGTPDPLSARHQLRPPIADFVGRASASGHLVATLRAALAQGGTAIGGIQGMGGIGKTELAVLVADQLVDAFPDAQIVLNLRGTSTDPLPIAQALQQVIHAFTPDAALPDDLDALQRHYRTLLHGQRLLILADDAHDAAQVRPLLPSAGCALLITSRTRFTLPGMTTVDLELLTQAEASSLLRGISARLADEQAQALARACGYLPLALRISGSVLHNDPALPIAEYLARLADERLRLAALRDPDDPQLDVEAALALSYALLDTATQQVFRRLAVLAADFATPLALAVVAAPDGVDAEALLRSLLRRNLLIYDPARGRWRLHDLLRDLARGYLELGGEWEAAMWRYARAALQHAQETQAHYISGGDAALSALARFDAERSHSDAARRWAEVHAATPDGDQLLLAVALATRYIGTLRYDARRERIPLGEGALAAARRLGDGCGAAQALHYLGNAYMILGPAQRACSYFEEAAATARTSGDQRTEGRALHNLGVTYLQLGEVRRAICSLEHILTTSRDLGDQDTSGLALSNLGFAYAAVGDAGRAIRVCARALRIQRALGNRRGEGVALCHLGHAYTALGHPRRAIACCIRAVAIFQEIGDQHNEAEALVEIGHAYALLGDSQPAGESCEDALTIARAIGDRRLEGYALNYLAQAQARQGQDAGAITTFAQALACSQAVGDRAGAAECQWHFGLALAHLGECERALPLLRAALAYEEEIGHTQAQAHAELLAQLEAGRLCREIAVSGAVTSSEF